MDKDNLKLLYEVMEGQQCKGCPFNDTCELLIDNYKQDICQVIFNKLIGGKENV